VNEGLRTAWASPSHLNLFLNYEFFRHFRTQKLLKTGQGNDITYSTGWNMGTDPGNLKCNNDAADLTVTTVTSPEPHGLDDQ